MSQYRKQIPYKETIPTLQRLPDRRRPSDIEPIKLVINNYELSSHNTSQSREYEFLLFATFLESLLYALDCFLNKNSWKIASMVIGFLLFIYTAVLYTLNRMKMQNFAQVEKHFLLAAVIIGFINPFFVIHRGSTTYLCALIPTVSLKVAFLIHISAPLLVVPLMVCFVSLYSILVNVIGGCDACLFDYIQCLLFFILFVIVIVWVAKKSKKSDHKEAVESKDSWRTEEAFFKMFDHIEDGVIMLESGHLSYSNQGFKRIFKDSSCGQTIGSLDSLEDKEASFLLRRFNNIKNIRAKDPALQSQLNDLIKDDVHMTMRDQSITKIATKHIDSPDLLLHSERELTLMTLYSNFVNRSNFFKQRGLGFNPSAGLLSLETFEGSLDNVLITIHLGYLESDNKTHLCMVFQSNALQKENQDLARELETCKKIPQYVAHELRNPIGGAQSFLESAENDLLMSPALNERYITPTINMLRYSLSLINDLVDAGQIAAGRFKVAIDVLSLDDVIDNIISMFELKVQAKSINISKIIDKRLPASIYSDSARLSQILINLVSNALKYTPRNGTIVIKADLNVLNRHKIDLCVEDNGYGIRAEDQKNLICDFGRVDNKENAKLNPYGAGLGLAISDKLARQLGVEGAQEGLKIESVLGKGTKMKFSIESKKNEGEELVKRTFTTYLQTMGSPHGSKGSENFSLSIEESNIPSLEISKSVGPIMRGAGAQKVRRTMTVLKRLNEVDGKVVCKCPKALIIDDDAFSGNSLKAMLKGFKIDVDVVQGTEESLGLIGYDSWKRRNCKSCTGYGVIFIDGLMPGMDGFESTKLLGEKMKENQMKECPVVFCTGLGEDEEARAKSMGASYFVSKPILKLTLKKILVNIGLFSSPKSP